MAYLKENLINLTDVRVKWATRGDKHFCPTHRAKYALHSANYAYFATWHNAFMPAYYALCILCPLHIMLAYYASILCQQNRVFGERLCRLCLKLAVYLLSTRQDCLHILAHREARLLQYVLL